MASEFGGVTYSKGDFKRKIKIPTILTPLLAEDLGFHIGDGCMRIQKEFNCTKHSFSYHGNSLKDLDYFQNVLIPRKKELFNLDLVLKKHPKENTIYTRFYSKAIFDLFQHFDIPAGKKSNVGVPKRIKESNNEIKSSFLRGLADADFCVSIKNRENGIYPTIHFCSSSELLRDDVCVILEEFGIFFTKYKGIQIDKRFKAPVTVYRLDINGCKRLKKWIKIVGFSNKRNLDASAKF